MQREMYNMKILFTGASSFTGYWFVKELAEAGHEVIMTFQRNSDEYEGIRQSRVQMLQDLGHGVFGCKFGDTRFMQLIDQELSWDILCHHAADVTNYKSPEFDVVAAVQNNSFNLREVLTRLVARGCGRVLLTGSVFEGGEGAGSEGLPDFSPYGLSKALTARIVIYQTQVHGIHLGKFVIPNPFGPYEEPRFINYLMRSWHEGKTPSVNTPAYIRDNIHVSLLAKAYKDFAVNLPSDPGFQKLNPSGYVESQGNFAQRVARNMRERLSLPCELDLKQQVEFTEPRIRINTDPVEGQSLNWNEIQAWDELAEYYQRLYSAKSCK